MTTHAHHATDFWHIPPDPEALAAYTADKDAQAWNIWVFLWRPIDHRWFLPVDHSVSRAWTEDELALDPVLRLTFRPTAHVFGPLYAAMDMAARLPAPFVDTLKDSPFYTSDPETRRRMTPRVHR